MLRILGGIMIMGGSLGLGLWYREQFLGRLRALYRLRDILEALISEIRFGKATLPECCLHVGKKQPEPYRSAFLEIYARMSLNTGAAFEKVFGECMAEALGSLPVTEEDKTSFLAYLCREGAGDGALQLCNLEQGRGQLERTLSGLEGERAQKCRMSLGLGALGGLLLLIVLL